MQITIHYGTGKSKCQKCQQLIVSNEKQVSIEAYMRRGRFHLNCIEDTTYDRRTKC